MEGYGFDTQKEIISVLRWKENTNCYLLGGGVCTNHTLLLAQVLYEKASLKCKRWVYFICCG